MGNGLKFEMATDQVIEGDFSVRPFSASRGVWTRLVDSSPGATVYHSDSWLESLTRCYGVRLSLATIVHGSDVLAGCVLARSKNPLARRSISLPFSDYCQPLARDGAATNSLMEHLASDPSLRAGCEIRGVAGSSPWKTLDCFADWTLNLKRPLRLIERGLHGNFRRNLRRASRMSVQIEHGHELEHIERFYSLQLETRRHLGVPPQPLRTFKIVRDIFARLGGIEVWLASHGGTDAAALVMLRFRDRLYYKWGARRLSAPAGINHLLFWSLIEETAGKIDTLDLGRTDIRNEGLSRFKQQMGASKVPLPYAYFPKAPRHASAEVMSGARRIMSRLWRHLPLPATRVLGAAFYGFLT
jgi:GNAT acetyltransferase-like protein